MANSEFLQNIEVEDNERNEKRLEESAALIENPALAGEPGNDSVFLLGKVVKLENGDIEILIESGVPTVALNDKVKDEFNLTGSPTVKQIRNREVLSEQSLISAGTFIWCYEDGVPKLITLRRDEQAPVEKLSLTSPFGRCGEKPSKTAISELNEELVIVKTNDGKMKMLGFYNGKDDNADEIVHERLRRLEVNKKYLKQLLVFWDESEKSDHATTAIAKIKDRLDLISQIQGPKDIEMIESEKITAVPGKSVKITTKVDGIVVDEIENGFPYFDEQNNTLEAGQIVALPKEFQIQGIIDGDAGFLEDVIKFDPNYSLHFQGGREIIVSSPEEIANEPAVPALKNYLESIKN